MERYTIPFTVSAGGAATVYSSQKLEGRVHSVQYVDTNLDVGATITLSSETAAETIWTRAASAANVTLYPRMAVQDNAGVDVNYETTNKVREQFYLVRDRLKVVVSAGGNLKSGTIRVLIGD